MKLINDSHTYLRFFFQEAMRKAEAAGNEDCPVKIKLVAPPLYVLTTQTLDKVRQSSTLKIMICLITREHPSCILC